MVSQLEVRDLAHKVALARLVTTDPKEIESLAAEYGITLAEKDVQDTLRLVMGSKVFIR